MTTIVRKLTISEIDDDLNALMSEPLPDHYDDIVGDPKDKATGGWRLKNYATNNIALFNHNPNEPIGVFENVRWEDGALRGHLKMAPEGTSQRIDELRKLIQAGILKGISVGFRPIESVKRKDGSGTHFLKQELVECSVVATPALPSALLQAKALGISNATIREVFVQGNKNASLADRVLAARIATKYTERQRRESREKALATVARLDKTIPPKSTPKPAKPERRLTAAELERIQAERRRLANMTPAQKAVERAREAIARTDARIAREKAAWYEAHKDSEPLPPDPEVYTFYTWRGQKIPIPRYGLGGAGEENKPFEKAHKEFERKGGSYSWDEEEPGEE